jgi:phosphomannomutase
MNKLLLFDVDGTLAESGKKINKQIENLLQCLSEKYDIGIVGGGKLDKISWQLNNLECITHFFTECGCVYHKHGKQIYTKNIRHHKLYPKINILIKECLRFLSTVDYNLTGNFIDLRNGIIYVSLIGMVANDEEREMFIEKNKERNYRGELIHTLKEKAFELEIHNEITICEGGEVGIGIYPVEYDKTQVLEHLLDKYNEIHYFGDKYEKNGNDHNIINHKSVIGHPVNNINETIFILSNL